MRNPFRKKRFIFSFILLVGLTMASFGMRTPLSLGGLSKAQPKPRPRAVVRTAAKSCQEQLREHHSDTSIPAFLPVEPPPVTGRPESALPAIAVPDIFHKESVSRAPPA